MFRKPCFIGMQKSLNVNIKNKIQETKKKINEIDNKTKVFVGASLCRKKNVPGFENFYYLLDLNTTDTNNESRSEKSSQSKTVQRIHAKMHAWRLNMELQK